MQYGACWPHTWPIRRGGPPNKKLPKAERKRLQIKHAPKLTPRAKILKFADKISNLRSLATSPPADWPMQHRADYVAWTGKLCRVSEARQAYSNRNSTGLRQKLSGQFPWRQRAARIGIPKLPGSSGNSRRRIFLV